ncbi:hypothetical protein GCM10010393_33830 [Streptomyces gobitricini]|uniref:Integral membrane protein n=1 Tax=Streptomyces gobitricini TaxID=68211 RepID=A0ABN3MC30_9ACTN
MVPGMAVPRRAEPPAALSSAGPGSGGSPAAPGTAVRGDVQSGRTVRGRMAPRRAEAPAARRRLGTVVGAVVLVAVVWWQGGGAFVDGVRGIDGRTLAAAVGIGACTTVLSTWRWCLVARAVGVRLPFGRAVADYYRALFLNAALPGGVLGDVHRAVRHGRSAGDVGRGVRAVVLERVAGQVVLVVVGVVLLVTSSSPALAEARPAAIGAVTLAVVGGGPAAVVAVRLWRKTAASRRAAATVPVPGAGPGRVGPGVCAGVLLSSVAVLAGFLAMFLLAARAAGSAAPAGVLLPLMVLALLAMALPLNVAGWGPREGVAAWAFGAAGLGAAQGLTVSVVYGLLSLAASLPGAGVLVADWFTAVRRAPQVELEQGVLAEEDAPRGRTERVAHQRGAGEGEPGYAVAQQDRRHGDVQPVQRALVEEARHGAPSALHEYAAQSPARELPHQVAGGERRAVGQSQDVDPVAARHLAPAPAVGAHDPQGRRRAVGEHPVPRRHTTVRVEHDAHRVGPGTGAYGQPRIVRDGGAGADHHRVGEGAHPVQVRAVLLPGDVVGVTRAAGDEPVETLAELGEGEARAAQAQGQVTVGQIVRLGRAVPPPRPAVRTGDQPGGTGVRHGPDVPQPFPGLVRVDDAVVTGHRTLRRESGDRRARYSPKDPARATSNSLPFSADAREGRPMTPDSV